jgi:C4-dicarboxylate-specific signal transduction histidine kinase
VARPLREQFLLASLLVLVPVGIVMTWVSVASYSEQLEQLRQDARAVAGAAAAHVQRSPHETDAEIQEYLKAIPLPPGSLVKVTRSDGTIVAQHRSGGATVEELAADSVRIARQPWSVLVGIPTPVAWDRAVRQFTETVLISGLATLILLGIGMIFLRRFLPPLKSLERAAARVGTGDLSPLATGPMPSLELEHVRDAFGDMIEKLRGSRSEVELLQRQVIRQERLAAIGVLLSGIAHELNNPLQAISGSAEILQRDPAVSPDMRADLALIHKESARASGIIRNLSRFSRQQGTRPALTTTRDVVASVVELRQRRLHEQQIELVVEDRSTQSTLAVLAELQQVLLNFVVNAEQAIAGQPPPRRITIRTFDRDGFLNVEVEDSGAGVPPEDESKLFQPFFTTKPVGEGTGLGLSVSYGIIRSFGGSIGYRRGAGGGAVFHFELPTVVVARGP